MWLFKQFGWMKPFTILCLVYIACFILAILLIGQYIYINLLYFGFKWYILFIIDSIIYFRIVSTPNQITPQTCCLIRFFRFFSNTFSFFWGNPCRGWASSRVDITYTIWYMCRQILHDAWLSSFTSFTWFYSFLQSLHHSAVGIWMKRGTSPNPMEKVDQFVIVCGCVSFSTKGDLFTWFQPVGFRGIWKLAVF